MSKSETVEEIYKAHGLEYKGTAEEKELTRSQIKKEITDRAVNGDDEAYAAYSRIQKSEKVLLKQAAKAEFQECMVEFGELLEKDISKAGETREQQESRIWLSHPDLCCRMDRAQKILDDPYMR
jgi:hypothetical protein